MTTTPTRQWPDWFTDGYAQLMMERHLSDYVWMPDLKFLQIGAYCGDASEWLMENVVHLGSTLTDVDTWEGSSSHEGEHIPIDFAEVYELYKQRMAQYPNADHVRTTSDEFFRSCTEMYDFIYIDGSHQAHQVLRDAVNADWHLKPGGLLAFDDYGWSTWLKDRPGPAIDAFIACFGDRYEQVYVGYQVWLRKRDTGDEGR